MEAVAPCLLCLEIPAGISSLGLAWSTRALTMLGPSREQRWQGLHRSCVASQGGRDVERGAWCVPS